MTAFQRYFGALLLLILQICALDAKDKPHLFPKETCKLHDLKKKAKKLSANSYDQAEELYNEIRYRVEYDKSILALTYKTAEKFKDIASKYHAPFDVNRTGRQFKGLYVNASDVQMDGQYFIIACCPKNSKELRDYFDAALADNVVVFVSALQSREVKSRKNNFWTRKVLKNVVLRDDVTISHLYSQVLQVKEKSHRNTIPQIIETTLATSDGREFTHLHYEGWRDKSGMPCEDLLNTLLDRIYELSPDPQVPVAINCKGGAGRSGTIAVSLYLRRYVDAQLAQGVALDDIEVNIPEVIYSFRKQRRGIIGAQEQLVQLYSVLSDYYDKIKATS